MNKRFRMWIVRFFVLFALLCGVCASISYLVDPMWCFTHANRLNSRQLPFDERQQKSNYIVSRPSSYDALIMGSSRTNILDQRDIKGYTAFNFSVNGMMPEEYADYARFFKRHNSQNIKLIVLGVDFFGSNQNFKGYNPKSPDYYFQNAENRWYRFKTLLTLDSISYSVRNIRELYSPTAFAYYKRDATKTFIPIPADFRKASLARDLAEFDRYLYGKNYRYHDIKPKLLKLRDEYPACRFVVFTTPDSKLLWDFMLRSGRFEDYLRWLGDVIEVFGEVYDFMGENELTINMDNFQDAHHLTEQAAQKIVAQLFTASPQNKLEFGTLLTPGNFPAYAATMRTRYTGSIR
jgi:hypothetical protein